MGYVMSSAPVWAGVILITRSQAGPDLHYTKIQGMYEGKECFRMPLVSVCLRACILINYALYTVCSRMSLVCVCVSVCVHACLLIIHYTHLLLLWVLFGADKPMPWVEILETVLGEAPMYIWLPFLPDPPLQVPRALGNAFSALEHPLLSSPTPDHPLDLNQGLSPT